MRLLTFRLLSGAETTQDHIGVMLDDTSLVDLHRLYAIRHLGRGNETAIVQARVMLGQTMASFLAGGDASLEIAQALVEYARRGGVEDAIISVDDIQYRPPIPRPGKIIAMGRNFSDHAAESIAGLSEEFGREVKAPETPMGFIKASSSLIGHESAIVYPRVTQMLDYEVEMAIIIGKPGRYIKEEEAAQHIAGYSILNDISARDIQLKELANGPLLLSKSLDGCGPFGPYLVTKEEVGEPHQLAIKLTVNGEVRQDSTTARLIFGVPALVSYWSQMTLEAGDVITTGTPEGVALWRKPDPGPWFLKGGDLVEAEIEKVGLLRNPIVVEASETDG